MDDYKFDEQVSKDFEFAFQSQLVERQTFEEEEERDMDIPLIIEQIIHADETSSESLAEVSIHEFYLLFSSMSSPFLDYLDQKEINIIELLNNHFTSFQYNDVICADVLYILSIYAEIKKECIPALVELFYFQSSQTLTTHENTRVAISALKLMSVLIQYVSQNCESEIDINSIIFAETIMNLDKWGTYYLARIIYNCLRYCSFTTDEQKLLINTVVSIRNGSEHSEYYADCTICRICSFLIEKDPNIINYLNKCQLQGGLVETIEEQYFAFSMATTPGVKHLLMYQRALFSLLQQEFSLVFDDVVDYFVRIDADFLKTVIFASDFDIASMVIDMISDVIECGRYPRFSQNFMTSSIFSYISESHFGDNVFDAKATAVSFLSSCIHFSPEHMWREAIEYDFIQNASFVLEYDEANETLHLFLRSLVDLLIYGHDIGDFSINEILDDPLIMDPIIDISENCEVDEIAEIAKHIFDMMSEK